MYDMVISQAQVVNEGCIQVLDVAIQGERIAAIAPDLSQAACKQTLDAQGRYLLPGMIDDQVHFREPGLTHKGDMATESAAAVRGGITSFMEMPNVNPLTINAQALEDKYQRAQGRAHANYAFYLGASNDNLEQIKSLDPKTACGIKVFMGASTGNMLVDDPRVLEEIFAHAPTLVVTHCEDTPSIHALEAEYRAKYGEDVPMAYHAKIRSEEACWKSSSFAVDLARKQGTQLHVLHLTTARELALFTAGPIANKQITAEACVHHLFFNEEDYATLGALIKCNPSIKTAADQAALLQAVVEDRIDVIATDHAPHTWEEKQHTYFKAPSGLPLVEHALPSLFEHYHAGRLSLEKIVQKTSHAVAERFQVQARGYLREGYFADLVLVDLNANSPITHENCHYKCAWTPFAGQTFQSRIEATWVNGQLAWSQTQGLAPAQGQRLQFLR
ncbi:dihydroorotase [Allopseudospirillum japonicum]|uniref:Dihydroorotase n=1 Tax=Allopseudospirillum japonicum TaxID=64971 RepID=A0A1H6SAM3_9GAMM|nr:dihydroorotase [Allopseudospirillum japonicum]SEI64909.1 dihydroorotase [Allopseudospirillum japonicum]